MQLLKKLQEMSVVNILFRIRFIKFGLVGFSGTLINIGVLYINQAFLLSNVNPPEKRLHISLAIAISIATFNNYLWNRWWTWRDRRRAKKQAFFVQMGQYYLACTVAICFQYLLTTILAGFIHYLIANMISIVLAAIFVYVINDIWTFGILRRKERQSVSHLWTVRTEKRGLF